MSQITITKGKLIKEDKEVKIEYTQRLSSDVEAAVCTYDQKGTPRKEMRIAFDKLKPHVALLSEFVSLKGIKKIEDVSDESIEDLNVSGFSLSSGKSGEGVILTAQKTLSNGKKMGFNTPTTKS